VSAVSELGGAILSTGNLTTLAASSADWARFGALVGRVNRLRGYGDFLHYHLLARGALDAVLRIGHQYPRHRGAERDRARGRRHCH
jgi:histidinol-phosphatase